MKLRTWLLVFFLHWRRGPGSLAAARAAAMVHNAEVDIQKLLHAGRQNTDYGGGTR